MVMSRMRNANLTGRINSPLNPHLRHATSAELYGIEFLFNQKPNNTPTYCGVCGENIIKGHWQFEFLAGRVNPAAKPYMHHVHEPCFLKELVRMVLEEGRDINIDQLIPGIVMDKLNGTA